MSISHTKPLALLQLLSIRIPTLQALILFNISIPLKVKHKPRQRTLTHDRPPARDLRDLKRALDSEKLHISPKIKCKGTDDRDNTLNDPRRPLPKGREDGSRPEETGSSRKPFLSFPPLPVSLSGWEAPQEVVYGTDSPSNDGMSRKDYTSSSRCSRRGVITMMKPREKLLKGLLRRPDVNISV